MRSSLALAGPLILMAARVETAPRAGSIWHYDVQAGPGARELQVQLKLPAGTGPALVLDDGMGPFVREAAVAEGRSWKTIEVASDRLVVPMCVRRACHLRYRILLEEAARALRDRSRVSLQNGALIAAPSAWLAHPALPDASRFRLRVHTPPGVVFVSGLFASTEERGAYEATVQDLEAAPYSAFGAFETDSVRVGDAVVEVAIGPGERELSRSEIVAWVGRSARAVAAGYGRFPLPRTLVIVIPGGRRAVGFGTTMGNGGGSIMIWVGQGATTYDLQRDWVLTHEMVHLGLPNLPRRNRWLEEGLATYFEPVVRARAGLIDAAEAWGGMVRGMPNGLPGPEDGGLDGTRRWGRIYWGGALYWLMADLEIRERTHGRRSLDDALRGILAEGGTIAVRWDLARMLAAGDRATGVSVLRELHERLGLSAEGTDLDRLWARLGVVVREGRVSFDDTAPLAAIRRAISGRPTAAGHSGT